MSIYVSPVSLRRKRVLCKLTHYFYACSFSRQELIDLKLALPIATDAIYHPGKVYALCLPASVLSDVTNYGAIAVSQQVWRNISLWTMENEDDFKGIVHERGTGEDRTMVKPENRDIPNDGSKDNERIPTDRDGLRRE